MSHIDAEGRRRSERQRGNTPHQPPASSTTPHTPMLNIQPIPINHTNQSNPSPTNGDLSYSTTNETISPGNHLFAPDSTTTSNLSELPAHNSANVNQQTLYNHQPIQGTTVTSNSQHFQPQTSYIPQQYNPYISQYPQSLPPTDVK